MYSSPELKGWLNGSISSPNLSLSLSLSPPPSLPPALHHSLSPLQIGYWEVYDGAAIRELEGSQSGAINGMHVSQDGRYFITGKKPHWTS